MSEESNTIDCTPTWLGLLPAMLEVYKQHGSPHESTCEIYAEFVRMATAADKFNELAGQAPGDQRPPRKEESNE